MTWLFFFAAAFLYWLTRYSRALATAPKLRFLEYAELEWPNLLWGILGGFGLYALYALVAPQVFKVACGKWEWLGQAAFPNFDGLPLYWQCGLTALFGAGGKSFADRFPRILGWVGIKLKLPGGVGGA